MRKVFSLLSKLLKWWYLFHNASVKVRSKTIVKNYNWIESVICVQLHLSGRRGKFENFLEFSVLYVCPLHSKQANLPHNQAFVRYLPSFLGKLGITQPQAGIHKLSWKGTWLQRGMLWVWFLEARPILRVLNQLSNKVTAFALQMARPSHGLNDKVKWQPHFQHIKRHKDSLLNTTSVLNILTFKHTECVIFYPQQEASRFK